MTRTLLVGYGNPSRRDDGMGLAVVNGVRARLGRPPLHRGDEGAIEAGGPVDTLFQHQLTPELAGDLAAYDRVLLVDAHVGIFPETVHRQAVEPQDCPGLVSHILRPEQLLSLAAKLAGRVPETILYSIRGFDFDFGEKLSPETAAGVEQVITEIWRSLVPPQD